MYEIYYKDTLVFRFQKGCVQIANEKYLPFDIYLEESDDFDDKVNNVVNFNAWCASRVLTLDRCYAKEILNYFGLSQCTTDAERAKIAISTRCLSLNDCYWLKKDSERLTWNDVNLFNNSLENSIFEVALTGKTLTITNTELINPDISTDGKAAKAWLREKSSFFLLKGDKCGSVTKEVEASQILSALGFPNVGYDYYLFEDEKVSRCKCFTSEHTNFVRAQWFSVWCENHDTSILSYITKFQEAFDRMNLADYLVGNSDEHSLNWGFLYDNDMNIISMNPLMDYDHAFESLPNSICLPSYYLGFPVTQETMALSVAQKHPDWINQDVDLSGFQYGSFVEKRIEHLRNIMQEQEQKNNTSEYYDL